MKVWRIYHKPTGMYFVPNRMINSTWKKWSPNSIGFRYVKSNLSNKGKLYTKNPTLSYMPSIIDTHIHEGQSFFKFDPAEWEVVEVK